MAPDIATLFNLRGLDFTAEERTRDRTVTRQLLSYRYSFTQDRTINIPWWRRKGGQCMVGVRERKKVGWGRSATPLTIFVLLDNVGPFWLGNVNQGGKAPTSPQALLNLLNGGTPKRHPPQSDLSSSHTPSSSSTSLSLSVLPDSPYQLYSRIFPNCPTQFAYCVTQNRSSKSTALDGHTKPLKSQSRQPPSGPSAVQQKPPHKGKQVEINGASKPLPAQ
jgi:hypothetical protein